MRIILKYYSFFDVHPIVSPGYRFEISYLNIHNEIIWKSEFSVHSYIFAFFIIFSVHCFPRTNLNVYNYLKYDEKSYKV